MVYNLNEQKTKMCNISTLFASSEHEIMVMLLPKKCFWSAGLLLPAKYGLVPYINDMHDECMHCNCNNGTCIMNTEQGHCCTNNLQGYDYHTATEHECLSI